MFLKQIHDPGLSQYAYLIGCQRTGEALLIDPERDIDRYQRIAAQENLRVTAVAETHIHADFVSGVRDFLIFGSDVRAYLSDMGGSDWKYEWAKGREDVTLLRDGDTFRVGNIEIRALHTPGHTPEHICFLIEDRGNGVDEPMALVSGDFVFVGDVGRPDLLETAAGQVGSREISARRLYESIRNFAELPDYLQVLPGHGAGSSCGKALGAIPSTTVGYEKFSNRAIVTALEEGEEAFLREILSGQPEPPPYFARMKQVNRTGMKLLDGLPDPGILMPVELMGIAGRNNARDAFLDVRTRRSDFMDFHVRGSLYAPFGPRFSTAAGSYLDPDDEIHLLVEDYAQVEPCVRGLVRMGFDSVASYSIIGDVLSTSECAPILTHTRMIKPSEIEEVRRRNLDSTVLDVRSLDEYEECHVEGALHIAYTRLAAERDRLPDAGDGAIIVHCQTGERAAMASSYLEHLGYEAILTDGVFTEREKAVDHELCRECPKGVSA